MKYLTILLILTLFPLASAFDFPHTIVNIDYTGNLTNLSEMQDVNIPTPTNDYVLTFDSATTKWIAKSVGSAGDTNETTRFNALDSYDCPAGKLVIGVQPNGTVLCADDQGQAYTHLTNFTDDISWTSGFNTTFDSRDSDTTYTNGTGLNLTGNVLSIALSYFTGKFIELTATFGGEVSGTYDNLVLDNDALDDQYVELIDLPLANLTSPYCGNITGAVSNLCTLTSSADGTGSWMNDSTSTNTSLNVNIDGDINITGDYQLNGTKLNSSNIPDHNGHTVRDTFVHIINRGKAEAITVTLTGGLGVNWTAGEIYDHTSQSFTTTDAGSGVFTNTAVNYLKWVSGSTLTLSTSDATATEVLIATGSVYDGNINGFREASLISESSANARRGLRALFPTRIISGMSVHEDIDVTNSLDVTMDAGVIWKEAMEKNTPIEIKSRNTNLVRNFHTAGVWDSDTNAQIETTNYDNGTDLVSIPSNKWVKGLFIFMNGKIGFVYPTEYFTNKAEAEETSLPAMPTGLEPIPKLTAVVYQQGDTDFTNAVWQDVRAGISEQAFGGVSDHGALAGLSDDDHPQYLLADGTRNATELFITNNLTADWIKGNIDYTETDPLWTANQSSYSTTAEILALGFYNDITNFTGTLTNDKICIYDSSQNIINCSYTDQTGAGGNVKSGDGTYTYNDTDTIYFNTTLAGTDLEVNGSNYWDNYNTANSTWFQNIAGALSLKLSQLTSWANTWLGTKSTDDLSEGSTNLYDDTSWNKTYADTLYADISVVNTDTQDLSYNTATDVISLVDGGSVNISEVNTDTQLTEDQVEAMIFDDDNTDNIQVEGYNVTNVSYQTFCNGINCWKMYVNASDYFIIEEI